MSTPIKLGDYARTRTGSKLRSVLNTVEQLRKLHTPIAVCRGCCSALCCGDCDWADEYDGELLTICSHCCLDSYENKQNYTCLDFHEHGAEYGPQKSICATGEILDGLEPTRPDRASCAIEDVEAVKDHG